LELDNHTIYLEWKLLSEYALLTVNIAIVNEYIQTKKYTIIKNSKEEKNFIAKLIEAIKGLNMAHITSKEVLK